MITKNAMQKIKSNKINKQNKKGLKADYTGNYPAPLAQRFIKQERFKSHI